MTNNGLRPYEVMKNSHQDWLGKVPNHWKLAKAKRIFRETSIKNHPDEELLSVTQKLGVIPRRLLDTRVVMPMGNFESFKLVKEGHFIISLRSFQGGLECSKYQGIVSPAYNVLEEYIGQNRMYFRHLMKSQVFISELQRNVTGIRQGKNVDVNDFKEIILPIPPRSEQDQIVKYLDHKLAKINKFIKAKKKLIAVLKEQKQAIINEAVTKGMDPNVKMKTSGIEWLGDVPEHWQKDKANRLFRRIGSGTTPSSGTTKYYNGNIKWINSGDLNDDYLLDTRKTVSKIALADYSVLQVYPKKSIVVAMYGATIGKLSITEFEACCNQACCVLGNLKSIVNLEYAFYSLYGCKSSLIEKSRGGGQPNISQEIIKQTWLPIPPMSEQAVIVNHIRKSTEFIESCILRVSNEIKLILEYKNSLISEVVTGKVDVRKIAINESEEEIVEDTELDEDLINEESLKAEDGDE